MKGHSAPIVKQIQELSFMSLLFCNFRNTTAYHLDRHKTSTSVTKELRVCHISLFPSKASPPQTPPHPCCVHVKLKPCLNYCQFCVSAIVVKGSKIIPLKLEHKSRRRRFLGILFKNHNFYASVPCHTFCCGDGDGGSTRSTQICFFASKSNQTNKKLTHCLLQKDSSVVVVVFGITTFWNAFSSLGVTE